MVYRFVKKIFKIQPVHPYINKTSIILRGIFMSLILASTSPYRADLLHRLQMVFRSEAPNTDETKLPGECPSDMVARLALAKARAVSAQNPDAYVIGSDQIATLSGKTMGKPGNHKAATAQLQACSGQEVLFLTGVALVRESSDSMQVHVEPFTVTFRALSNTTIENYLHAEKPYDCAGSFKCEGLGIALFSKLNGDDPTSLQGLPLISVVTMLNRENAGPLSL
jgi:septum formation protein